MTVGGAAHGDVDDGTARREERDALVSADRAKAFVDAVVAIAMTLLILPLTEAVTRTSGRLDTSAWFGDHAAELVSFGLSFVLIAMFWTTHHRLFAHVERVSVGLLWINVGWLATIVWLPVATAIVGATGRNDPIAGSVYIGTMILSSAFLLTMRLFLRAHPRLHAATEAGLRSGIAVDIGMILLFGISLVLFLTIDAIGYWALLLMFLTGPVQALVARILHADRGAARAAGT